MQYFTVITCTFESLFEEPIQQCAAVVAERRRHVVVDLKPVRNVKVESLG